MEPNTITLEFVYTQVHEKEIPTSFFQRETKKRYTFGETSVTPTLENVDLLLAIMADPKKYNVSESVVKDSTLKEFTLDSLLGIKSNVASSYGGQIYSQMAFILYDYCPFYILTSPSNKDFWAFANYVLPYATNKTHMEKCYTYDAGRVARVKCKKNDKVVLFEDAYVSVADLKTTKKKTTLVICNESYRQPVLSGKYKTTVDNASLGKNLYKSKKSDISLNPMIFSCSGILRCLDKNTIDCFIKQCTRVCEFLGDNLSKCDERYGLLNLYKFLDYNDCGI